MVNYVFFIENLVSELCGIELGNKVVYYFFNLKIFEFLIYFCNVVKLVLKLEF